MGMLRERAAKPQSRGPNIFIGAYCVSWAPKPQSRGPNIFIGAYCVSWRQSRSRERQNHSACRVSWRRSRSRERQNHRGVLRERAAKPQFRALDFDRDEIREWAVTSHATE